MRVLIYVVKKRSEHIENFSGKQFKSMQSFHRSKKCFANFYRILLMFLLLSFN